jgi:succinate dehydrogenase / fumarate reductase flavoprotein subunit
MARNEESLKKAIVDIRILRDKFYSDVKVLGKIGEMNPELDKAGRVADFLELGELMCMDALAREESCGGHFREEFQSKEGEAVRKDDEFAFVAAWEFAESDPGKSKLHKEELSFENVELNTRSYK